MVQYGKSFPVQAPIKGLNTRDTGIGPLEARELINWLPDISACVIRKGYTLHQEVSAASVGTLAAYAHNGAETLICAADGKIWDVTSTPSELSAGPYTSDTWQTEQYGGYLFATNGQDTPWRYNGTAVVATGFTGTGLTLSDLSSVRQVRNRLWLTEVDSLNPWYGAVGGVTGALTKFDLSQIVPSGNCIDVNAWSRDTGAGMDDFTVFITSTGWVVVYEGDVGTDFSLVGKYKIPVPVGVGCSVKVGGDLVVMTASGPIPVAAAMTGIAQNPVLMQDWGKISSSWSDDYDNYCTVPGWNAAFHNGLVYFNVPENYDTRKQYVFNTRNNAWCVFSGINAHSFAEFGTELYFSSAAEGAVYKFIKGSDNGTPIVATARQGYLLALDDDASKIYTAVWPGISADQSVTAQFQVDTDFITDDIRVTPVTLRYTAGAGMSWGDDWGGAWGEKGQVRQKWYGLKGWGSYAGPVVRVQSAAEEVTWRSLDIIAIPGGML